MMKTMSLLLLTALCSWAGQEGLSDRTTVFSVDRADGLYGTFQPTATITEDGTIFAFCQGRLGSTKDNVAKRILMSKSSDGGKTWSPQRSISPKLVNYAYTAYTTKVNGKERIYVVYGIKIHDHHEFVEKYGQELAGDEVALFNRHVGEYKPAVFSTFQRIYSDDQGETWQEDYISADQNLTAKTNGQGHTIVGFMPIGGLLKLRADHWILAGTAYCRGGKGKTSGGIIVSHDQGLTWEMGSITENFNGNESSITTLRDGKTLLMVSRNTLLQREKGRAGIGCAWLQTSSDRGKTWSKPEATEHHYTRCLIDIDRVGHTIVFSTPLGISPDQPFKGAARIRGSITFSEDDGKTWNVALVEEGGFSYSHILPLDAESFLIFYTQGHHGEKNVSVKRITLDGLNKKGSNAKYKY